MLEDAHAWASITGPPGVWWMRWLGRGFSVVRKEQPLGYSGQACGNLHFHIFCLMEAGDSGVFLVGEGGPAPPTRLPFWRKWLENR